MTVVALFQRRRRRSRRRRRRLEKDALLAKEHRTNNHTKGQQDSFGIQRTLHRDIFL